MFFVFELNLVYCRKKMSIHHWFVPNNRMLQYIVILMLIFKLLMLCFDRLLTKGKNEEELKQRLLAAEAQINELKARFNESNNKQKHVDAENAVSPLYFHQQFVLYSIISKNGNVFCYANAMQNNVCLFMPLFSFADVYTVSHKKTCHFVFDNNSSVSWSIFILFVPVEMGRNTLQFTYLMA